MDEHELRAEFPAMRRIVVIAQGAQRWIRQHIIDADAKAHYDKVVNGNEGLMRLVTGCRS
jgi:hypothetical protein